MIPNDFLAIANHLWQSTLFAAIAGLLRPMLADINIVAAPSVARERGIPMVLGVRDATQKIPDGAPVAVDGVAGIVRWLR